MTNNFVEIPGNFIRKEEIPTIIRTSHLNSNKYERLEYSNSKHLASNYYFSTWNNEIGLAEYSNLGEEMKEEVRDIDMICEIEIPFVINPEQRDTFLNLVNALGAESNISICVYEYGEDVLDGEDEDLPTEIQMETDVVGNVRLKSTTENPDELVDVALQIAQAAGIALHDKDSLVEAVYKICQENEINNRIKKLAKLARDLLPTIDEQEASERIDIHEFSHYFTNRNINQIPTEDSDTQKSAERAIAADNADVLDEALAIFSELQGRTVIDTLEDLSLSKYSLYIRLAKLLKTNVDKISLFDTVSTSRLDIEDHLDRVVSFSEHGLYEFDEHDLATLVLILGPDHLPTEDSNTSLLKLGVHVNDEFVLKRIDSIIEDPETFLKTLDSDYYDRLQSRLRVHVQEAIRLSELEQSKDTKKVSEN